MKFCAIACGADQPVVVSPARTCTKCKAKVPGGDAFCSACGQTFAAPPASASPLFTAEGARVELDLVVRVQGQHQDFDPSRIDGALVRAVAMHWRSVSLAEAEHGGRVQRLQRGRARRAGAGARELRPEPRVRRHR